MFSPGLRDASTDVLKALLRRVHREELPCPFTGRDLLILGLNQAAEECTILFGLDARAVRTVLACTLSERLKPQTRARWAADS